jgi:hypothetical protein
VLLPARVIPLESVRCCWTLAHSSSRLACTVTAKPAGGYILRLTCNGGRLLDVHYSRLTRALDRSRDAFAALSVRGWVPEEVAN